MDMTERKYGGFIAGPLSVVDRRLLFFYFLLTILDNLGALYDRPLGPILSLTIPLIIGMCIFTGPIGQRFVRLNYSLVWFLFVFKFAVVDYFILHYTISCLLPLYCFIVYQIVRYLFWKNEKLDFVPLVLSGAGISLRKSKLVNREATDLDKKYMIILIIFGSIGLLLNMFLIDSTNLLSGLSFS